MPMPGVWRRETDPIDNQEKSVRLWWWWWWRWIWSSQVDSFICSCILKLLITILHPGLPTGEAAVEVTEVVAAMGEVVVVDMVVVEAMVEGPRLPAMESETHHARGRDTQRRSCEHWRRKLE